MYSTCSRKHLQHTPQHTCMLTALTHMDNHILRMMSFVKHGKDDNACFCEVGEQRLTLQQLPKQKTIWIAQTSGLYQYVYACRGDAVHNQCVHWGNKKERRATEATKCHLFSIDLDVNPFSLLWILANVSFIQDHVFLYNMLMIQIVFYFGIFLTYILMLTPFVYWVSHFLQL